LGGYVKVAGVIDESLDTNHTGGPDQFHSKNTLQKIWIMSAGVIMNFILSTLLFSYLTYYSGINDPDPKSMIGHLIPDYPAEILGMKVGDEIISINGNKVSNWEETTNEIHSKPDELIKLSWISDGMLLNGSIKTKIAEQLPWNNEIKQGMIGIAPIYHHRDAKFMESFSNGFIQTYQWLKLTCRSLIALMSGDVSMKEMAGPIMIAKMAGETASSGGIMALL